MSFLLRNNKIQHRGGLPWCGPVEGGSLLRPDETDEDYSVHHMRVAPEKRRRCTWGRNLTSVFVLLYQ